MYITSKIAIFITTFDAKLIFSTSNLDYKIFLSMFINSRSIILGTLDVFISLQNLINIRKEMV